MAGDSISIPSPVEPRNAPDSKKIASFILAAGIVLSMVACTGCLSSAPPPATSWIVESSVPSGLPPVEPKPVFAATRLGGVSVLAPYDQQPFTVKRVDGSVAFDPCNRFAAQPAALVRGVLMANLAADGRFGHVVPQNSIVNSDAVVEVVVPELSLDCSTEGVRKARASVSVNVVRGGRSARDVAMSGSGTGEADAADGNYSAAFGNAVNTAIANALSGLK